MVGKLWGLTGQNAFPPLLLLIANIVTILHIIYSLLVQECVCATSCDIGARLDVIMFESDRPH